MNDLSQFTAQRADTVEEILRSRPTGWSRSTLTFYSLNSYILTCNVVLLYEVNIIAKSEVRIYTVSTKKRPP